MKHLTQPGAAAATHAIHAVPSLDTYILQLGDPVDLQVLIDSLRSTPQPGDVDVIVGRRGAIAPAELCNGLMVPIVIADQIYSFDRESFIKSIPRQNITRHNLR